MRRWDADGNAEEGDPDAVLDYSAPNTNSTDEEAERGRDSTRKVDYVDQKEWGSKTSKGEFVLKDLDMEVSAILKEPGQKDASAGGSSGGLGAFSFFRNLVGGKVLTKTDLEKPMAAMLDQLLKKNVAREAALQVCDSVEKSLIGQKTGSFQSIEVPVRAALEAALRKILTPTNSLDLLREIQTKRSDRRPYVISIVGVNGVGKSTNLSKICFFLLQNKYKVLVAACDTFRSGAVEQLRVHVRNLKELTEREGGVVELYEKGYGKDAANIAKDAVAHGGAEGYDVVLIDTAGRRHNDQRLMSSLEKFAKFANPDKILMVGEALVGTDSVLQARNFNAAFGSDRSLDGFIISKCDTVGDMIGTLISMVFATGIPVQFLGVGQNYQDLRTLNVSWAVKLLMS
jgi:signal recognition particle receptor subunit alpha